MRRLSLLPAVLLLAFLSGCGTMRFDWLKGGGGGADKGPPREVPPVARLIDYLNANANLVQSVRYEDVGLTITNTKDHQSFGVTAQLVVDKPRNFRMKARLAGGDVADVGSNNQEFWWWNKKDAQPYQYYCSYKDLSEGRVRDLNFPIQPEWIIETLGMGQYGPVTRYKLEHDAETVKLVEKTVSPSGRAVRKVIVFQRRPKSAPQAMVSDFMLIDDATGREICSAHVAEVHPLSVATQNAVLPRKLEVNWPDMKIRLTLQMDRLSVSPRESLVPATAFVRQPMNGIPSFNVATGRPDTQIQQTGARN